MMVQPFRVTLVIGFLSIIFYTLARQNSRYDKSINLFSPEGDLLQVGYAEIASEKGSTVVCAPVNDNSLVVCIESDPDFDILLDKKHIDKISKVDDNIWMCFSGLVGDGRSMVRKARKFCLEYHVQYGSSPTVSSLANYLGEIQHQATLAGDERPLGVHALLCGYDSTQPRPRIFSTRASGRVSAWKTFSIGQKSDKVMKWLESRFVNSTSLHDTIRMSIDAIESTYSASLGETKDAIDEVHRKYDIYHLKYGLDGNPIVAIASLSQSENVTDIRWKRRNDVNNIGATDGDESKKENIS